MLLKDNKGNFFQIDDLLTGPVARQEQAEHEDCDECPYHGMCEEEAVESNQPAEKVILFEISVN
jgi:hypothetical protein